MMARWLLLSLATTTSATTRLTRPAAKQGHARVWQCDLHWQPGNWFRHVCREGFFPPGALGGGGGFAGLLPPTSIAANLAVGTTLNPSASSGAPDLAPSFLGSQLAIHRCLSVQCARAGLVLTE